MYRNADCEKYRKWKAERAKKSKQIRKVKKRKRKGRTIDCVDEDEIENAATKPVLRFNYRKCEKEKRKKKKRIPGQLSRKIFKRVSVADLVLNCIKPSMKEREYLLNPRHANCLGLKVSIMDIAAETATSSKSYADDRPKSGKRIPCSKGKRKRSSRKELEDSESEVSECESVCSFDSEVCLAGVKLTSRDKEEIKKYQRKSQEATTREED